MNNYSCLDYWYFFWDDFCKEIQITGEQFMALFNDVEIPNHRYSPVPQNIIEPKVLKKTLVPPKDVVIDIEKLLNSDDKKIENVSATRTDSNNKIENVITHKTSEEKPVTPDFIKEFTLINQSDDEFEVLEIV
jgi:hypothetical protein